eukprot:1881886-Rhodomonas_salina.1
MVDHGIHTAARRNSFAYLAMKLQASDVTHVHRDTPTENHEKARSGITECGVGSPSKVGIPMSTNLKRSVL